MSFSYHSPAHELLFCIYFTKFSNCRFDLTIIIILLLLLLLFILELLKKKLGVNKIIIITLSFI